MANRLRHRTAATGASPRHAPATQRHNGENVLIRSFLLIAILLLPTTGCGGCKKESDRSASKRPTTQSARARQHLLEDLIGKFNSLPKFVNLELSLPRVILDARSSTDQEEMLATCGPNPSLPSGPNNLLTVVTNNAGFVRRRIQPGDLVRYFAKQDEESRNLGIASFGYFEMTVAQVLDDNRVIVDASLSDSVEEPYKLQVWRDVDERSEDIRRRLSLYAKHGLHPLDWEPSPDEVALEQGLQGLNQWLARAKPSQDWKFSPFLDSLPKELKQSKTLGRYLSAEALGKLTFEEHESRLLQQAVWLRDISLWARGDTVDDLSRATSLFDWTVRNVQLIKADDTMPPRMPWESLLYGKGTAAERAWVFAMLARQQRLDVVMLLPEQPADGLPALFSEGRFYLFDPTLGLPIPGPDGTGVATLSDVRANDAVFRQLDLEASPYPQTAESWKSVTAAVVASPLALSHRGRVFENQLAGKEAFVLTARPTVLAEKMRSGNQIADAVLWDVPFRTFLAKRLLTASRDRKRPGEKRKRIQRTRAAIDFRVFTLIPDLWKARVLHFQGTRETVIDRLHRGLMVEIDSHKESLKYYRRSRPTTGDLTKITSMEEQQLKTLAKQHASYWTGLMRFDDGKPGVAADWLKEQTLDAWPDGPWTDGARYNLARAYETLDRLDEAITLYESDTSPQRHGNRIRARRLRPLAPK